MPGCTEHRLRKLYVHHETLPHWAGDPLHLDYVLTTLMQRRIIREHQRERLQERLLAA